jgi:sec-independent protein translocase protein TatA
VAKTPGNGRFGALILFAGPLETGEHQFRGANRPKKETIMLNNIGLPGLLLIAVVVLVLFGRGKISSLMGEVGKGITSFKKGVNDGKKELEDAAVAEAKDVTPEKEKEDA